MLWGNEGPSKINSDAPSSTDHLSDSSEERRRLLDVHLLSVEPPAQKDFGKAVDHRGANSSDLPKGQIWQVRRAFQDPLHGGVD